MIYLPLQFRYKVFVVVKRSKEKNGSKHIFNKVSQANDVKLSKVDVNSNELFLACVLTSIFLANN